MSLKAFFEPKNVAIIGASSDKGSVGFTIMENFVRLKFKGKFFPINPHRKEILGEKCHKSVLEIKHEIDLAIICTPSKTVPMVLQECAQKKVKAVVIISAGFAEIGEKELTQSVQEIISANPGMRVIGPNCLGVMYQKNNLDTLFLPISRLERPKDGVVSFISQSGALGSAILDWASLRDYGINKFISYGNAMDVDEADLLEFLGHDSETKVILIYIEGVKHGRKFFEIAKRVCRKKPTILLKGGMTEGGAKATQSHTGSLAGSIEVYKALFKQTGIIHADSLKNMFDYAKAFTTEPEIRGNKIQIITNGGGYGVLTTDAVIRTGLQLAEMEEKTSQTLKAKMPSHVVIHNPIDLTGDADNERFRIAIEECLKDKNIDAIILIILFQTPTLDRKIDKVIKECLQNRKKPVMILSIGGKFAMEHKQHLEQEGFSTFSSPQSATNSLKALYDFYSRKEK
ncbi:MAG: CoA-binding protein [Candidatus Diapherotrites archaeon]|nr:CoA-binding protein [Candidatus Diapherotrites archaeon]